MRLKSGANANSTWLARQHKSSREGKNKMSLMRLEAQEVAKKKRK